MRRIDGFALWVGTARDARDIKGVLDAGLEAVVDLALMCDFVICSEEARIGFPATRANVERAIGLRGSANTAGLYRPGVPFRVLSEEAERTILEEALNHHAGQMAATARALGLERSHLYKKAKALGLREAKDDTKEDE